MRKNVLILCHSDGPQFIDVCNQYTTLFDKDKYEVTVAYLTGEPSEDTHKRSITENVLFLNVPKKDIRSLKIKAIKKLLALCKEKNFEVVICHRYKPSYIMLWVSRFCKIPVLIFTMHEFGTMSSYGRRALIALMYRQNMLFAGVSNSIRDDLRKDLWGVPKSNIVTLYNAADIDWTLPQLLSREEARKRLSLPEGSFVFGNLARLVPNKDHDTLFRAFAKVKPLCPNAKLIVLGSGHLEKQLKDQVAALGLENDIIFTGFVTAAFTYMKAFDCFVLSSVQEAFGRVLLEAMIAKIPVIGSQVHGIAEVMSDAGLLVTPRDVDGFAKAMQTIYEATQSQRNELAEKGYQRAENIFSVKKFYQDFWQIPLLKNLV